MSQGSQVHNQVTIILEAEGTLMLMVSKDSTTPELFVQLGSIADCQDKRRHWFDRTFFRCGRDAVLVLRPGMRQFLHRQHVAGHALGVWSQHGDKVVQIYRDLIFSKELQNHSQSVGSPKFTMSQKHLVLQDDQMLCGSVICKHFESISRIDPSFDREQAILFDAYDIKGVAEHQFVQVPSFQLIHPDTANATVDQIIARLTQDTYLRSVDGAPAKADVAINLMKAKIQELKQEKLNYPILKEENPKLRAENVDLKQRNDELHARIAAMEAGEPARKVFKNNK